MEDHKDELILILAGYNQEMEFFLQSNPGLRSRFPIHIDFPDYTDQELLEISEQMLMKRQYQLTTQSKLLLIKMLNMPKMSGEEFFGNARTMRNIIEKAIRRQAVRLMAKSIITREDLMAVEPGDLMEVRDKCENA